MYLTIIFITLFGVWILLEMRKAKRAIRIPIISLFLLVLFIGGTKLGTYFFDMNRMFIEHDIKLLEKKIKNNDLYSVKASIVTYNRAIKKMNNYSALIRISKVLQNDGRYDFMKKFYEDDPLMQTNIESKIINKSDN